MAGQCTRVILTGMTDDDLRLRLATVFLEALEIGSGKQEWDVVDDVFSAFDLNWSETEAGFAHLSTRRAESLREYAARRLAHAVPTAPDLLNVVVRCGGRFVSMLDETYARLARHSATTSGSSETFRLERNGVDETQLTISPAFLEQVHQIMERIQRSPLGAIDEFALASFTLWDNGESYGRWPVTSDKDEDRLINAALNLSWIGPIIRQREATDPSWGAAASHWVEAHEAAETLASAAEALVRSHAAHLDALVDVDAGSAAGKVFADDELAWRKDVRVAEIERFRAERSFGSTAVPRFVHDIQEQSGVGLRDDLKPVVVPVDGYWPQTGVGGLAAFVAMWRLGLWAEREQEMPANRDRLRDPTITAEWLSWVASACTEATAWLENAVLDVTSTVDVIEQIDAMEEFLNLPLWRQRNLLYEVWVLCATLDACESAGWTVKLTGLTPVDGAWTLSVGATEKPIARMCLRADKRVLLDVWREPSRRTTAGVLTPDVTISTLGPYPRDLLVVEAKDRTKMAVGKGAPAGSTLDQAESSQRTALGVAQKYAAGLHPNATWICNHCDFRQGVEPTINHGDAWTRTHLADQFRPGEVPKAFTDSVRTALRPAQSGGPEATEQPIPTSGFVLAVDVTRSMQPRMEAAFAKLSAAEGAQFAKYRAVLFSDHGNGEPFLVRKLGPFPNLAALIDSVRAQPNGAGGDYEEALEDAMQRCRELVDDIGPQTILVLTDAPPHDTQGCPYKIDFTAEVQALLDLGCQLQVANDWLDPKDRTWNDFAGMAGFKLAPLETLVTSGWGAAEH